MDAPILELVVKRHCRGKRPQIVARNREQAHVTQNSANHVLGVVALLRDIVAAVRHSDDKFCVFARLHVVSDFTIPGSETPEMVAHCLLYTSPSPRDRTRS